jgi:hypothetical protein
MIPSCKITPMRNLFLVFLLLEPYVVCNAQNLVPNASFEDTIACPNNYDQMYNASGWSAYRNSPDYLNSCNNSGVSVPNNSFGYQLAATGNGYANLLTYYTQSVNSRECIGRQLQTLIVGHKYTASFKVSCASSYLNQINIATNKIGIKFSTVSYSYSNPIPIDNIAQIWTDSIISDTTNWITISGTFIADSSYEYLSIGNFFVDSLTSVLLLDSNGSLSHYFVDDIFVGPDSTENISENRSNDNFFVFLNSSNNKFQLTGDIPKSIKVFDFLGKIIKIIYPVILGGELIEFDVPGTGPYVVICDFGNGCVKSKLIIKS